MADLNYCRFGNSYTAVHVFTNQKMCRLANSLCKVFLIIPVELIYYQYASYSGNVLLVNVSVVFKKKKSSYFRGFLTLNFGCN